MPGGVVEQGESLKGVMLNAMRVEHFIDYTLTKSPLADRFFLV
ncbi:hypothetical protein SAMN04487786_0440 [Paenisporosarcina quisquiliarum]|nr:hypothetical protein SAMN04487786_0440 [Paenisporosarcina quisquiliarum]